MNAGVVILCRYSSSRLPGKILLPIGNKTVLDYIVERVQSAGESFVVATSVHESDDCIESFCQTKGWNIFRGSLTDVAARFLHCAEQFGYDFAARINGDNLFVDPTLLRELMGFARRGAYDFVTNVKGRTYPPGASIEIVRISKYHALLKNFEQNSDHEHVTSYIYRNESCCSIFFHYNAHPERSSGISLAIDTRSDYERATRIISAMTRDHRDYSTDDVVALAKAL